MNPQQVRLDNVVALTHDVRKRWLVEVGLTLATAVVALAYVSLFLARSSGSFVGGMLACAHAITGWWTPGWDPASAVLSAEGAIIGALFVAITTRGAGVEATIADAARVGLVDRAVAWGTRFLSATQVAVALGSLRLGTSAYLLAVVVAVVGLGNIYLVHALDKRAWQHAYDVKRAITVMQTFTEAHAQLAPPRPNPWRTARYVGSVAAVTLVSIVLLVKLPLPSQTTRLAALTLTLCLPAVHALATVGGLPSPRSVLRRRTGVRPHITSPLVIAGVFIVILDGAILPVGAAQPGVLAVMAGLDLVHLGLVAWWVFSRGVDMTAGQVFMRRRRSAATMATTSGRSLLAATPTPPRPTGPGRPASRRVRAVHRMPRRSVVR